MSDKRYPSITPEYVRELIDFAPKGVMQSQAIADMQLDGTVALFNMLIQNGCAYLADEVGMGKTYVALGVMSLMRYINPHARIIVVAPRENIQVKWIKEQKNFVHNNWKVVGHRVKSIQGEPAWEPVACNSLLDFTHEALLNADRDFFLRMTSFSLALNDIDRRKKLRRSLFKLLPWLDRSILRLRNADRFRDNIGCAFNAAVPEVDLLVVDEAHNLKHGLGTHASTRNRVMATTFGHPREDTDQMHWYGPRAKHVLLLSATPFEEDYAALFKQFHLFGFGDKKLRDARGKPGRSLSDLTNPELSVDEKREIVSRIMLRRVTSLKINDEHLTKNMYRREWRKGGVTQHDEPIAIEDPKQKLVIALMQKKVAEVLQHEKFNNHFQIGMLSSFESFLESVENKRQRQRELEEDETDQVATFDGKQQATDDERKGIDTDTITELVADYRHRFGQGLPHPKLDATADSLKKVFETGDKTLMFVRRVATVDELAAKLDSYFDQWIKNKLDKALPELASELDALFTAYERDRMRRPDEQLEHHPVDEAEPDPLEASEQRLYLDDNDEGSAETFFAWFFRGKGPSGYLSGAAFQKNRLSSVAAVYSTLFEENYVAWLLERPDDVFAKLAQTCNQSTDELIIQLRNLAYGYFRHRSKQKEGYPRLYVFEAYQFAALELLEKYGNAELRVKAQSILEERFPGTQPQVADAPKGFPDSEKVLGSSTFFTELVRRPELRKHLWPDEQNDDFRQYFRRREQRRELISAMSRLGAAYIDLYILAIRDLGSFELGREKDTEGADDLLAKKYADLLEAQSTTPGFHAYYELSHAADAFDLIVATNFPEVPKLELCELATLYGATLQRQVPIGRMAGGVNKRLVRQFRLPGFPLVLVSTDVLQEGEDLHTFCKKIIHYGIAWTPSSMEQRTGRIDRIGSLFERFANKQYKPLAGDDLIQVHYPYLQGTVEVLQVRKVLSRLNRFLELMHVPENNNQAYESRIDMAREVLSGVDIQPALSGPLQSAFPVHEEWLQGKYMKKHFSAPNLDMYLEFFDKLWLRLAKELDMKIHRTSERRVKSGNLRMFIGEELCSSDIKLELRSQAAGDAVFIMGKLEIGRVDLRNDENLESLIELSADGLLSKICARPAGQRGEDIVTLEKEMLFHPKTTQMEEVSVLLHSLLEDSYYTKNMLGILET